MSEVLKENLKVLNHWNVLKTIVLSLASPIIWKFVVIKTNVKFRKKKNKTKINQFQLRKSKWKKISQNQKASIKAEIKKKKKLNSNYRYRHLLRHKLLKLTDNSKAQSKLQT